MNEEKISFADVLLAEKKRRAIDSPWTAEDSAKFDFHFCFCSSQAGMLKWTASTSKDVAYYELWVAYTGVMRPAATSRTEGNQTNLPIYGNRDVDVFTSDIYLKSVNRGGFSSTFSSALFTGSWSVSSTYGTANMAGQTSSSVAITGGSTIGQSSVGATNFFANDASSGISGATTAVDVQDANFRVFAGTTQKLRIDYTNGEVYIQSSRVLSTRKTGWSTATGTATRTTFATSTVTTEQLAERVKALIDDLHSTAGHGLIGT